MSFKVFYSWQSDVPAKFNRTFIQTAAERALKALRKDGEIEAALDRDTKGVAGTPDIADTIFSKIRGSDVFLADVTPVSRRRGEFRRSVPNSNVMTELGFAIREIGWDDIVLVVNMVYGPELPFHLRQRRHPIKYGYGSVTLSPQAARAELECDLKMALRDILAQRKHPRNVAIVFKDGGGHHDAPDGRRLLLTRIENVSGRQLCRGVLTITDLKGEHICGLPIRFTENPAPTMSNLFAPETWDCAAGWGSDIPVATKMTGETNASVFTAAQFFFPTAAWFPALPTYPLGIGSNRARISITYGGPNPAEKEFIIKNLGPNLSDFTLEDG